MKRFTGWYNTQVRINQTYGSDFDTEDPRLGLMQRVFHNNSLNISYDSYGRVQIPFESSFYDRKSLSFLNVESLGVDLIIRAYATDKKRKQDTSSLSIEEATVLLKDLHELLVHFGFLAKDDLKFVRRFYRDTSLFVPHANGDEWVDFGEAVSFLHYVLSGNENSKLMKENGLMDCAFEVDGKNEFIHSCFKEKFLENHPLYLGHLDELNSYLLDLKENDPVNLQVFMDNLVETVSAKVAITGRFTNGELLKFHVLLQYVETFMYRFDLDKNAYMDPREAELFLDDFMSPIAMLLGQNQEGVDEFIRAFFT